MKPLLIGLIWVYYWCGISDECTSILIVLYIIPCNCQLFMYSNVNRIIKQKEENVRSGLGSASR